MSTPVTRIQMLFRQLTSSRHLPQQDSAMIKTQKGYTWIQWQGYHNMCVYFAHPDSKAAKESNLSDRAALGFTDGLPNVMLIPDPSDGLYRPVYQLEDLINQTRKSYVFAERTFPRINFQASFRDLGGYSLNDTTYIKCSTLYQHNGIPNNLNVNDLTYLHSIRLNVFITFDDIEDNRNSAPSWAGRTLSYIIPNPPIEQNDGAVYCIFATDPTYCLVFGQFIRDLSCDISEISRDETDRQGIMFGSNSNVLKTTWSVALICMCLGMTKKDIVKDYIQTSRSFREYGGSDAGRSASHLVEALDFVLQKFETFGKYLEDKCQVRKEHTEAITKEMCLPMMPYSERHATTKHNGV